MAGRQAQPGSRVRPQTMLAVSVVIPAYNEEGGVVEAVRRVSQAFLREEWPHEIILVNDCSTDSTAGRLRELTGRVQVVTHEINRGYGASLLSGIRRARYDVIAIIDADGTYPYEELPMLVRQLEGTDMVVGARLGPGSRGPWMRRPAKWLLGQLANYLTGQRIPDLNSGMRVMRRPIVMQFRRLLPPNFSFTTTITLAMLTNQYAVRYVPITYQRRIGRSKIHPVRDTFNFLQLIIRTVMYFAPLKVFLPLSLSLLAGTIASGVMDVRANNLTDKTVFFFIGFMMTLAIGCLADLIDKRLGVSE